MRRKVGMRSWGVVEFGVGVIDDATLLVLRRSRRLQPHCRGDPIVQRLILRRPRPEVKAPPAAKKAVRLRLQQGQASLCPLWGQRR